MEVVILNLGDASQSSGVEILDLLNTLFSPSISPEDKKQKLNDQFGIAMSTEFDNEVNKMCNLSRAIEEQAMRQGEENRNLFVARMMIEDHEPLDKIIRYTGYAVDRIREIAQSMGIKSFVDSK